MNPAGARMTSLRLTDLSVNKSQPSIAARGPEAHRSKLGVAEVVQRRVQGGRDSDMWSRGVILKRAKSPPRITARRGGGGIKKMVRSLLLDAAGEVILVPSIGTAPRPREERMLRDIS